MTEDREAEALQAARMIWSEPGIREFVGGIGKRVDR